MQASVIKTRINIHDDCVTTLRGIINAPKMPRYSQKDFTDDVLQHEYYLVIHLQKLDVFSSLEDVGDFEVFATVEWGGIQVTTKQVRSALINETIHFNMPIEEDIKNEEGKLIDFLNEDLKTKSDVRFNVWVDYGEKQIDNIGTAYASLSLLYNADADEKSYKDTVTKKRIRHHTRIYNGKINLKSAFHDTSSCNLFFGMWFQHEIPNPGVDLSKLYGSSGRDEDFPSDIKQKLIDQDFKVKFENEIDNNFQEK